MTTLVLGLGNLLLADEGVGVHAARALMTSGCPDRTTVLDVGTSILDALPWLEQADHAILIDAVKGGEKPGTVYRMPIEGFSPSRCIASMHGFDIFRVLALTKRKVPPRVVVIGVEPARIDWSMELSAEVAAVLPTVLHTVKEEVAIMNVRPVEDNKVMSHEETGDTLGRAGSLLDVSNVELVQVVDVPHVVDRLHAAAVPQP